MKRVARVEIIALAKDLPVGETKQIICPYCNGGQSKELTFSLTRAGAGVIYNCFRATCGARGFVPTKFAPIKSSKKEFKPHVYDYKLIELGNQQKRFFFDNYGISPEELTKNRFLYNYMRSSFVMPLLTPERWQYGLIDRAYWGRLPKSISYFFSDRPKLHWPIQEIKRNKPILLVEDVLSSIKASRYMNTVALIGTSFNEEMINSIKMHTDKVVMALDQDATNKSIGFKQKYSIYFENFTILPLSKDIKDMDNDKVEEMLNEYR